MDLLCFLGFLTSYSSSSRSCKQDEQRVCYEQEKAGTALVRARVPGCTHLPLHGVVAGLLLGGETLILLL